MLGSIEKKVKASTAATFAVSLVLAILTWVQDRPDVLAPLPQWAQGLILLVVPTAVTFLSGYLAAHTPTPADPPFPTIPPPADGAGGAPPSASTP